MDDDKMEVDMDVPTALPSSSVIHTEHSPPSPLASSSTEDRLKFALPESQLTDSRSEVSKADTGSLRIKKTFSSKEAMGVPIGDMDAVISAFRTQYLGEAHLAMIKAIDNIHSESMEPGSVYLKSIFITQSSGTGKSRLADEVAKMRITLPLCLREYAGRDSFAYPPPDIELRDFFLGAPSARTWECKDYLRSFFRSLFDAVRDEAKEWFGDSATTIPYSTIVQRFHSLFADVTERNSFYDRVLSKREARSIASQSDISRSFKDAKEILTDHCSDWPDKSQCPIIISIDEVQVLFTARPQDSRSSLTLFSQLKSVLSGIAHFDLCVLFLSTVISVTRLAPPKAVSNSLHEMSHERVLSAPFTEVGFDVFLNAEPLEYGKSTLASVGSLEFTAKFGRPLFYAMYISGIANKDPVEKIILDIMRTVRIKLSGRLVPRSEAVLDSSTIAILSARLLLDLSPAASMARQYEEEQVRSHLRMLYSVNQHRETIVTGSSPEPLIAEASAELMHFTIINSSVPFMDVWKLVVQFVDRGLLPQGTIGELLGRVFSIFAMDRAIGATSKKCDLKYQAPITVAEYYRALLTDEAWNVLKSSTPANRARLPRKSSTKSFEDAFADAYLHFSHYGKANDGTPIQDCYGWALWLRGTAILCQPNQTRTNRALPIFFSKPKGTLSAESTSMVLDQDKTGQNEDPTTVAIQSAEILGVFTQGQKLPYINAVHCYALTSDECLSVSNMTTYDLRALSTDKEAPRYDINFLGLAAYRNITEDMKSDIRRMIDGAENAVFTYHPRQGNLGLVRQMLPVLSEDPSATHWFGGLD